MHSLFLTLACTLVWLTDGTLFNTEVEQKGQALLQSLAPPSQPIARQAGSLGGGTGAGREAGGPLALVQLKSDPDQLGPSPLLSLWSTTKLRQGFHSNENSLKGRKGGRKGSGWGEQRGNTDAIFYIDLHQAQQGAMKTCETP